jgi:ornithine cyclodeaminase/alanine dehydrogenase-like protein (mu-crystallin family)
LNDTILYLNSMDMDRILRLSSVIGWIEDAFAADGRGEIETFPVISYKDKSANGTWIIKSGVLHRANEVDTLGLKAGSYWPVNEKERGMPNHNATMMLVDLETGSVSTVLNANHVTSLRTAAAGAISSKWLARPDSARIALLGAGDQAHAQLEAHLFLLPSLCEFTVWSRSEKHARQFATVWQAKGVSVVGCCDVHRAARDADIIITTTPSREPILFSDSVKAGAHIVAIGSDAAGKQEIDAELVTRCAVFADKRIQSVTIGEMQQPISRRLVDESHILAELGEVCAGRHLGRESSDQITLFDSSGVSFQDLIVARHAREEALRQNIGHFLPR